MRYREGQEIPTQIDPLIGDGSMIFTALLGLLIGVVLSLLARKGKVMWLTVWSAGLVLISVAYLVFLVVS